MFVDACAIVSIMMREPTFPDYERVLEDTDLPFTSPLAVWEAILVLARPDKLGTSLSKTLMAVATWLDTWDVEVRNPGAPMEVLTYAVAVAERHGVGKKALSNFDCFHYAQAKAAGAPMLTLDALLRQTDVETLP